MDIINRSRALNILVPKAIDQSNKYTKEIKKRMRINKILSEFETKASNDLNYFINSSNNRYKGTKLGNGLNSLLTNSRTKNLSEANKILNDRFYTELDLENERQKMKYKSGHKIYKSIQETFNKIKSPLDKKFLNQKDSNYMNGYNEKNSINDSLNKSNDLENNSYKNNTYANTELCEKNKRVIRNILQKEQNFIDYTINKYMETIRNMQQSISVDESNEPTPKKKYDFTLPQIKLLNYRHYCPPKRDLDAEEELLKPDIRKLLPYSVMGKSLSYKKQLNSPKQNIEVNCPFITEAGYHPAKENDYHNTLNIVYNSANKELSLQSNFDKKRKELENLLGVNEIPRLNMYDDITRRKSIDIKNERNSKNKKIYEKQKYGALSDKDKVNIIIDNDMDLLDKVEQNIYKNCDN